MDNVKLALVAVGLAIVVVIAVIAYMARSEADDLSVPYDLITEFVLGEKKQSRHRGGNDDSSDLC